MDQLVQFATYMVLVSVAAERLVEMSKATPLFSVVEKKFHGVTYQLLAAFAGAAVCFVNPPEINMHMNEWVRIALVGLMCSGGSSVWHELLTMLNLTAKLLTMKKDIAAADVAAATNALTTNAAKEETK